MHVERNKLSRVLLSLLGKRSSGLRLENTGVTVAGPRQRHVAFSEIASPATTTDGILFCSISLAISDKSAVEVSGVARRKAESFVDALNERWRHAVGAEVAAHTAELTALHQVMQRLEQPRRDPAACLLEPFRARTEALLRTIPWPLSDLTLPADHARALDALTAFHRDPASVRDRAIETFMQVELSKMSDFFDRIESNPLTPEQRTAVVTDEDATLVLAGAGSGKTSVITAKAAYLVERGIRAPEEILLLAFGKDAAAEMSERIEQKCGAPVTASTFHALAYGIIGEVEGQAPALAAHASDDAQFLALLREIITDLASRPGEAVALLVQWFAEFFHPGLSMWEFRNRHEYYSYVEEYELRTMQGEQVRSFEELEIANWLYVNGIAYDYEPDYEHPLPENDRRSYTPDFRLQESGVYIEHFGVRRTVARDGSERLTTAPFVDRESYLQEMAWKRQIHAEHDTTLIETYSYEREEGQLTAVLAKKLEPFVTYRPLPGDKVLERLKELGRIDTFTQMLGTFLRHYKGYGRRGEDASQSTQGGNLTARDHAFLRIFESVFAAYEERLGPRIDFEDMINRATDHVRAGRYRSPFRHLLVDEFQDISQGRADLLRALRAQHDDARIFAVGDDWQSIYRFAGSDIRLMRNFGREFGGSFPGTTGIHRTVDLGRTFRSVDRIALPARSFVLKNPAQITKQVIPAGTSPDPAIRISYSAPRQMESALQQILTEIGASASAGNGGRKTTVLLLGRYRHLRPKSLSALEGAHPRLSISFRTVHASKGLEADHVVILALETGRLGFPSGIADDPILDLVMPEPENFDHAEERWVFYVALTRARLSVTLVAPQDKRSPFVKELAENAEYGVAERGDTPSQTRHACPVCGGRLLPKRTGSGRVRVACEHKAHCETVRPACSICGNDLPERSSSNPDVFECSCGSRSPACPDCTDGWLIERRGRYGKFLGCVNYPHCTGRGRGTAAS